jgi:Rps23 Pro-64 3,4-dihydroxylase Tpa1-like proline 4-hydroxylase
LPVDVLNRVVDNFPKPNELDWWVFNDNNEIKLGSKKEMQLPQVARNVCQELNSGYVLDWLESLTGVPRLIADTRLFGGGLHQTVNGGKLSIHVDFNIEPHTKLRRRLNFLIYLNKDWQDEWEGHLELWDVNKTKCVKRIAPEFNRAVIFNTNGSSWHGHPTPLKTPEHITRKSLALYYYNVDTENVIVQGTTY